MKIELELEPFTVPNFVIVKARPGRREDGIQPNTSFPLSQVAPADLSRMCDDFKRAVMAKAGHKVEVS